MESVEDVSFAPMPESSYMKPNRMSYVHNGRRRYWDLVQTQESVSCILFNREEKTLIFVKQFRPAVFACKAVLLQGKKTFTEVDWPSVPRSLGVTIELCAGIIDDATKNPQETMKKEVLEECGYDIPLENFQRIINYQAACGLTGSTTTLFYAEAESSMKVGDGRSALIDVVEMSIPEVRKFIESDSIPSPGNLLFGIIWFLNNKAPKDF